MTTTRAAIMAEALRCAAVIEEHMRLGNHLGRHTEPLLLAHCKRVIADQEARIAKAEAALASLEKEEA